MVHDVNYSTSVQMRTELECGVPSGAATGCGVLPAAVQSAALPVAGEVFQQLMAIGEGLRQHITTVAARFDFTPQQALLVERLITPRTMGQIAEALGCDKSNVTGLISRLEARGLVARTTDQHDRRIKWLTLTEDGWAVREMLREQILQGQDVLNGFSEDDRATFLDYLRRASASLTTPMSDMACRGAASAGSAGTCSTREPVDSLGRAATRFESTST